jgi:hypothetical protein
LKLKIFAYLNSLKIDLIVEMLTVLANYNITVEELKAIFYRLKGENQIWVILKTKKCHELFKIQIITKVML